VSGQSGGRSEFLKERSRREAGRESEFAAANPPKQVPVISLSGYPYPAFCSWPEMSLIPSFR